MRKSFPEELFAQTKTKLLQMIGENKNISAQAQFTNCFLPMNAHYLNIYCFAVVEGINRGGYSLLRALAWVNFFVEANRTSRLGLCFRSFPARRCLGRLNARLFGGFGVGLSLFRFGCIFGGICRRGRLGLV